jgi:O-antigen ligase
MYGNLAGRQSRGWFSWGAIAGILAVTAFASWLMRLLPASSFDDGTVSILADAALFFVLLCLVVGTAVVKKLSERKMIFLLALTTWWILLVNEEFFSRVNNGFGMGQFSLYAYAEAAMWLVCGAVLFILTLRRPEYLRQLFTGTSKWITSFVLVCVVSIAWTPGPTYALAWGFKLVLAVGLLQLCSSLIEDISDVQLFLKVTALAFVVLTVLPVYYATKDPDGFFYEGRLNADPDLLSPLAAALMVMSMMLYVTTKKRYWAVIGAVAAVTMLLAFGKAGVIGGFLAAGLFMLLQRKVVRGLGLLLGLGVLAVIIISATPLADYLQSYQGAATLTGRTEIWKMAISAMKTSPILGRGYLATYFSWENTSGLKSGYVHVHNGFLEVAYNNGIVGEFLLLAVHFMMLRNIFGSIKACKALRSLQPGSEQAWTAYVLTVGCLGLYVHTFIQGLLGGHFGGRCMSPYMLWLALVMMTAAIRRATEVMLQRARLAREPLFAVSGMETFDLVPSQN